MNNFQDEEHHPDSLEDNFNILTEGGQDKEFIILKLKGQIKISQISFGESNCKTLCF